MGILIKDDNYVVPLRQLKFKGDQILIPVGDIKGQFLPFTVASEEHLKFLKRHYGTTVKTMSYRISKNEITWIEDLESLKEKLFPTPKGKKSTSTPKVTEVPKPSNTPNTVPSKKKKKTPKSRYNPPVSVPNRIPKSSDEKIVRLPATLQNVSRYFSTFPSKLNKLLIDKGYEELTPDSLLSKSQFDWLRQVFKLDKDRKHNRIENLNYEWTEFGEYPDLTPKEPIPKPAPKPNPEPVNPIFLKRDSFTTPVQKVEYPGLAVIQSYFQDIQARLICSRMSSSFARSIAEKHSKASEGEDQDLLTYQLHYMANKALKVFGGKILTLIYELRPLPFARKTALEVKTYDLVRPDFPLICFRSENHGQVNIAFFTKLHRDRKTLRPYVILFKDKTYETIGSIDELGYIRMQLNSFRPRLSLFIDQINEKKFKIYSGVESGVCDRCKLPLREPLSLRMGIGPVCAKIIGLDRSNYDEP